MWILIAAIATASLLGSMHCVGMCGPLAIWASGSTVNNPRRQVAAATTLYHIGRLITYALAGLVAGAAGGLIDMGGQALGYQLFAARVVGLLMVAIGVQQLGSNLRRRKTAFAPVPLKPPKPSMINRLLIGLRPFVFGLPPLARGLATGLLTALLPCGWLYLFALVAAGTGSVVTGPIVMVAFWIGTVPALVGLVAGTQLLAQRFRRLVPALAAGLLIVAGGYTAAGRGFARLNSLADIRSSSQLVAPKLSGDSQPQVAPMDLAHELRLLTETPLPCCSEEAGLPEFHKGAAR